MEKYEVLRPNVGEGSYGIVSHAINKETREEVAIKHFKNVDQMENAQLRKAAVKELRILRILHHKTSHTNTNSKSYCNSQLRHFHDASQLSHENIIKFIEAFRCAKQQTFSIVFEFCPHTLLRLISKNKNGLQWKDVHSICLQICKAVQWCHNHSILHRDIKPENILLNQNNVVKLCDFGFARQVYRGSSNDLNNKDHPHTHYVATRWYRAPELLLNAPYSFPVDIWSIGCILAEMSNGEPLFKGESDIDQIYKIQCRIGNFPHSLTQHFNNSSKFKKLMFPTVTEPGESLRNAYHDRLTVEKNNELFYFLEKLLQLNPKDRLMIVDCVSKLNDIYFNVFTSKKVGLLPKGNKDGRRHSSTFFQLKLPTKRNNFTLNSGKVSTFPLIDYVDSTSNFRHLMLRLNLKHQQELEELNKTTVEVKPSVNHQKLETLKEKIILPPTKLTHLPKKKYSAKTNKNSIHLKSKLTKSSKLANDKNNSQSKRVTRYRRYKSSTTTSLSTITSTTKTSNATSSSTTIDTPGTTIFKKKIN
ncbi:hypothetical protein SNEBB_005048 [Seison nebaliae]|nr:hypothetical protein SNEBB_005048 [Seison nebaliae]